MTDSIAPKSDQLNADDLLAGPRTVQVEKVTEGAEDQPVNIHLAEFRGRPFRPSKSMRRVMVKVWGKESSAYIGKRMTLFRDPGITFGRDKVGGIRISHMSHISKRETLMLTVTRGRRAPYVVEPLPDGPPIITPEQADEIAAAIAKAADRAELDAIGAQLTTFDLAGHRGSLQGLWKSRAAELEASSNPGAKKDTAQTKPPTIRERLVAALVREGKTDEAEQLGYLSGEFKRAIKVLHDLTDAEAVEITDYLEGAQNQNQQ
ncbi:MULTISPECIES: hypothetical protein [unclassified Rhodococcus (in: high G+C Gram-positive bacteria)]|uniref:hypothetical protein n=1 Tax=unclassified Rhodococcus (in: high G+C Gram-positive bacteria) TaxID=192944 RepID=UPI0015E7691B|nr:MULTISPECIES: hypothetical protein [unclassified Rhodococcus (in: high G+C Gram-positive bacteria)]